MCLYFVENLEKLVKSSGINQTAHSLLKLTFTTIPFTTPLLQTLPYIGMQTSGWTWDVLPGHELEEHTSDTDAHYNKASVTVIVQRSQISRFLLY